MFFFVFLVRSFFPLFLTHVIHFDLLQSLIVFACARQRINIKFNREVFMALHYVLTLFEWIIIVYIKTTTFTHNSELAIVFILYFFLLYFVIFCFFNSFKKIKRRKKNKRLKTQISTCKNTQRLNAKNTNNNRYRTTPITTKRHQQIQSHTNNYKTAPTATEPHQ